MRRPKHTPEEGKAALRRKRARERDRRRCVGADGRTWGVKVKRTQITERQISIHSSRTIIDGLSTEITSCDHPLSFLFFFTVVDLFKKWLIVTNRYG